MMAYENTIVQAHLHFTGDGWRIYDRAFHIQAASRRTTDWTSVDASLSHASLLVCPAGPLSASSAAALGIDPLPVHGVLMTPHPRSKRQCLRRLLRQVHCY